MFYFITVSLNHYYNQSLLAISVSGSIIFQNLVLLLVLKSVVFARSEQIQVFYPQKYNLVRK